MQQSVRAQIRIELAVRNLKPADLARMTGRQTSSISRWLNDSMDRPLTVDVLEEIADALDMPAEEIVKRARLRLEAAEDDSPAA